MFDEPKDESWRLRFGSSPVPEGTGLDRFLAHRTVRSFSDRKVDESLVRLLIGCAQSAATSSLLQSWSVVSVQDPEARARAAALAGGQKQIETAAWFFVFVADLYRLQEATRAAGSPADALGTMEMYTVAVIDAALAAERMVCAAEALGLGTCYIGGMRNEPEAVRDLVGLPEKTAVLFGLCLGWPAEGQNEIKGRIGPEGVWFRERYGRTVDTSEYDERMRPYFGARGMDPAVTWSMRMGRRASRGGMSGREAWWGFLRSQGLAEE